MPGAREARWVHLLSGPPDPASTGRQTPAADDFVPVGELAALKSQQAVLEGEIAALRGLVERLYRELDIPRE
jgi:hypothetical protein